MEKVQHFLQFLFPDLPCHENCWCSPQPLPGLCAVAAGSSMWPGPVLSWRREVAQGCIQEQLWEPGGQPDPTAKVLGRHQASVLIVELLSMFQPLIYHLPIYGVLRRDVLSWRKEKHCRGQDWKGLLHGDGHFLA